MRQYKGIKYQIWNQNYIKFTNPSALVRELDGNGNLSVYKTGTAFRSLPEDMQMSIDQYCKKLIDNALESMNYHNTDEARRYLNQKDSQF